MDSINFPDLLFSKYKLKLYKQENNTYLIWDIIRKKKVKLTPEEWVRQNWVHCLIEEKKCPMPCVVVEHNIKYHTMNKRPDVVVFDKNAKPLLLTECKRTSTKITKSNNLFIQASLYYSVLKTPFICITNGLELITMKKAHNGFDIIDNNWDYHFLKKKSGQIRNALSDE